jgi:hypothetical protein
VEILGADLMWSRVGARPAVAVWYVPCLVKLKPPRARVVWENGSLPVDNRFPWGLMCSIEIC